MAFESLLSISILVSLHSFGNSFAALNITFKRMFAPIGKMVLKRLSGKTKCEPCLYVTNSASQSCDFSDNRFSALLTYFAAFHKQSSSEPMRITGKHLPHISVPHFPKEKLKIFHGRNYRNLSTVILRKGTIERQKRFISF